MRMMIVAIAMLPFAAFAEETSDADANQSCPVGMVWDGASGSCAVAANEGSPFDSLPGRPGCEGGAHRELTA